MDARIKSGHDGCWIGPEVSGRLRCAPAEIFQQLLDLGGRPRRTEQEALHFVAAFGAEPVELINGLHAFGCRGDVEAAAKAGDRSHNRHAIGALREILYERAIDLDLVERKATEIAE